MSVLVDDVALPPYLSRLLERLALRGEGNPALSKALGLTRYSTARYVAILMERTDTPTRAALVSWAWSSGWMQRAAPCAPISDEALPRRFGRSVQGAA